MAKKSATITYFDDVKVKCANCGSEYTLGSTSEKISVEICGSCHPFYTGKASLVDTAGRIEKFQARMGKAVGDAEKKAKKVKKRKEKLSITDLVADESVKKEKSQKKEKKAEPKAKKEEKKPEDRVEEGKAKESLKEEAPE